MKKRLTFITLLMLFCSTMFGQSHWGKPVDADKSMTMYGNIYLNGELLKRDNVQIGAFCDGELRGYASPVNVDEDYIFVLDISGKKNNETIEFKLYDPEYEGTPELLDDIKLDKRITFKEDDVFEMDINFTPSYWNKYEILPVVANSGQSMAVIAYICINGEYQNRNDIELAAYCGETLGSVVRPILIKNTQQYIATFNIYGQDGEEVTFKLYDHSGNVLSELLPLSSNYSVIFEDEGIIGLDPIYIDFYAPVVKINETEKYYYTLAEAVNKAEADQTITLLGDAQGEGIVIDKDITIDFGGFTYTFNELGVGSGTLTSNGFQIKKDHDVTLKNGTLAVAEAMKSVYYILIQNYANLTVEDMTLDGTNLDKWSGSDGDSYTLSNNSGNVNVTGTTKIIANDKGNLAFALDACYKSSYEAPVVTLGENVTVDGKVEVTGGQLYSDAALEAVVRKTVEGTTEGWGTLSAPTKDGKAVFNTTGQHDFYKYEESAELEWVYVGDELVENTYTMDAGRGYLYANTADTEVSFDGTLNNETVNHTLSYTESQALAGFNFVGNPFTHNITFAHFNGNIGDGYYVVGENGAFTAVEPSTATDVIAPFEAVLVQTSEAGNLAINKKAQVRREASNGALEIVVANANYSDVAYVSFNEGLGLEKLGHHNANVPLVYVSNDGKNFAIAKLTQEINEIPVSFEAKEMGSYTISVNAIGCEFREMYLTDRLTGEKTNLLMEDYTFVATSNDNADRFVINFATTKPESVVDNFIYMNNGNMIINNIEGDAVVRVLDVLGRPVAEYNVSESANIPTATFRSGVYMIQMIDNNGAKVQKITID